MLLLALGGWVRSVDRRSGEVLGRQALEQGKAAQESGNLAAAVGEFQKATRSAPDQPEHWYRLGTALGQLHRYGDAQGALLRAQKLDPANVEVLSALGFCSLDAGDASTAVQWLRKAVQADPAHPEANRFLAEALYVTTASPAELEEARASARRAVEARPDFVEAYFWQAKIALRLDQEKVAEGALRQALYLQPRDQGCLQLLGQLCQRQGRLAEASSLLQRFRETAELNTAFRGLEVRLQEEPRSADLRWEMGRLLTRAGQWARAVEEYGEALAIDPQHVGARRGLAEARAHLKGAADARH